MNKKDPSIYIPWLIQTWVAQLVIVLIYLIIILILGKRKDVK